MCTGVYVGKKVSSTGRTMIGRSADSAVRMDNVSTIKIYERKTKQSGKFITAVDSEIKYPLPDTTYKYLSMPSFPNDVRGSISSHTANEYGLFATSSVTASSCDEILNADPLTNNGICESAIPDIIATSCKNTTEAIKLIERLMKEFGSQGCENIMISDNKDAWIIELYSGHQWAACKMPEDKVSVYGNAFYLTTEHANCKEGDFYCSKDLFELPKSLGIDVYRDGVFSISESYDGADRFSPYASIRSHLAQNLLAPSTASPYDESAPRKPMFFTPDKKVSLKDVFEVFRCRYEGTKYCPEETGCDSARLIGTEATYEVGVAEIYEDAPLEASVVIWHCMGSAPNGVFLPTSSLLTKIAKSYEYVDQNSDIWGGKPLPKDEQNREKKYNEDIAFINFKKLSVLANENMKLYSPGVRKYWSEKEDKLIKDFSKMYADLLNKCKNNKDAAIEEINTYTINLENYTEAEAKAMFDELLWYIMSNIETLQYQHSQFTHETTPKETKAFEPTMCYLDKYLES